MPIDANEISFFVVMQFKIAMEGAMDCLTNSSRKVDIGRGDSQRVGGRFLDSHDPVERMLSLFSRFLVPGHPKQFGFLLANDGTSQGHHSSGEVVVDAMAGSAKLFMRLYGRLRHPSPLAIVVDRPATRAARRFREFSLCFVCIGNVVELGVPGDTSTAWGATRWDITLLHVASSASPHSCGSRFARSSIWARLRCPTFRQSSLIRRDLAATSRRFRLFSFMPRQILLERRLQNLHRPFRGIDFAFDYPGVDELGPAPWRHMHALA